MTSKKINVTISKRFFGISPMTENKMKKILWIIILMVFIGSPAVFAANLTSNEADAKVKASADKVRAVVENIKKNFQKDYNFPGLVNILYLRYSQYRYYVKETVFPDIYAIKDKEVKNSYYTITSDFMADQDKKFVESYRDLITTFCTYSVKYKDTPACSDDTVNGLLKMN